MNRYRNVLQLHHVGIKRISNCFRLLSSTSSISTLDNNDNKQQVLIDDKQQIFVDVFGRRLLKHEDKSGKRMPFYYDPVTFDSYEQLVVSKERPQYATAWEDEKFPGWIQYMDSTGKRPFYVDRANPMSQISWAPPAEANRDIFGEEQEKSRLPLKMVAEDLPGAPVTRRLAAFAIDVGASLGTGMGFGLLVFLDLGRMMDAAQGVGFSTFVFILMRDSIFERGTRSPGKKLMKLEIVRTDGQLPTRWHTGFRQLYLPIYTGAGLLLPYIVLLPIVDLGLVLFTKRSYRLGDIIGRTRVISEQPDREERFKEKCEREDADDAKD